MYLYIYVHMYVCTHTHIYIYIRIYIRIHIHIYIDKFIQIVIYLKIVARETAETVCERALLPSRTAVLSNSSSTIPVLQFVAVRYSVLQCNAV